MAKILLAIASLISCPILCSAQMLSPFSAFQSMSLNDLQTSQAKLTYLGPADTPIASVGLAVSAFDPNIFTPFRRAGIDYSNEEFVAFKTGVVSAQNMMSIINNVGMLPNVTAGGVASDPFVSFALSNTAGGTKVFEAILNNVDAAALFDQLRSALLQNPGGLSAVSTMACPLGVLDPATPNDVTANVSVTLSGFRLNRATGRFVGTASLSNSGPTAPGPVSLVVQFNGNVRLFNASGATCGTSPTGIPFINVTSGDLVTGSTSTVTLDLANPNNDPIQTSLVEVLSGPGTR
jgi:hypothetical protein